MQDTEAENSEPAQTGQASGNRLRGLLLAVGGAAAVALNFVTAKYARRQMGLFTFTTIWFTSAWFYTALYITIRRIPWREQLSGRWKKLLLIGVLHGGMALVAFEGIHILDPTVASFFARSSVVFGVLLGLIVLKERPTRMGWFGMAIAAAGGAILSYATGADELLGVVCMLTAAILLSFGLLVGKYVADTGSSVLTVFVRSGVITIMAGILSLATGGFDADIPLPHLAVTIGGAAVGPFGAQVLFFASLRYVSLSELSVIRATSPLFVAIYALVFLGMFPSTRQLIGGLIVIAGVIILSRSQPVEDDEKQQAPGEQG